MDLTPHLLVSDADRRQVVDLLVQHCGAGRLTLIEAEERIEQAIVARTAAELVAPLRELPTVYSQGLQRDHRPWSAVRVHAAIASVLVLLCWLREATGQTPGDQWPAVVTVICATVLAVHATVVVRRSQTRLGPFATL